MMTCIGEDRVQPTVKQQNDKRAALPAATAPWTAAAAAAVIQPRGNRDPRKQKGRRKKNRDGWGRGEARNVPG